MDFVDVNENNARWVQDFRLKAYASPAKLESIDGEGPDLGGSRVWGFRWACGPQSSLPLLLELSGACCQALWHHGPMATSCPASCAQRTSALLHLGGEVAGTWRYRRQDGAWALGASAGVGKVTK